jgi:DNA-directed RNA polymerase specialized sigma24 family protein
MSNEHYHGSAGRWPGADLPTPVTGQDPAAESFQRGWFGTTHWSVLLEADQNDCPRRMAALEKLCQMYWQPVYAFIRQNGYDVQDAEDLTQTFFALLLERNAIRNLDPKKGKFRSFILVLLRHFLANEAKRARAAKRGGGLMPLSLEAGLGEDHFLAGGPFDLPAEKLFDRQWALAVVARVFANLGAKFKQAGQSDRFERLKVFLTQEGSSEDYAKVASSLGLTTVAVKVAVHRLRHRYGELMRREIAHTVESPFEVENEMRYLLDLLIE